MRKAFDDKLIFQKHKETWLTVLATQVFSLKVIETRYKKETEENHSFCHLTS